MSALYLIVTLYCGAWYLCGLGFVLMVDSKHSNPEHGFDTWSKFIIFIFAPCAMPFLIGVQFGSKYND